MSSRLAKLKESLKKAAVNRGKIIIIERGVNRWRCENSFHGKKEMVYLSFPPASGIDELECECGTIYKKEDAK
jgi:hypothetical protein